MAVITPDGIVGKTRDVFGHTSQVLEISDATSGAGVIMENTRIRGVLRGNSWGQPEIVNVSPDERIKRGEPVMTSGGDCNLSARAGGGHGGPSGSPDPDGTLVNVLIEAGGESVEAGRGAGDYQHRRADARQMQQDLSDAEAEGIRDSGGAAAVARRIQTRRRRRRTAQRRAAAAL